MGKIDGVIDRLHRRRTVRIPVIVTGARCQQKATMVDISSRGAKLMVHRPVKVHEFVEIGTPRGLIVVGQVRWAMGGRIGIRLSELINVDAFLNGEANFRIGPTRPARGGGRGEPTLGPALALAGAHLHFVALAVVAVTAGYFLFGMVSSSLAPLAGLNLAARCEFR